MASVLKSLFVSKRRISFFLVTILVVALAVSVYAYLSSLPPSGGPRVTITSPPLEFSLELDKAEYLSGENITITFCVRNISNQTIQVTWPFWVPYDYEYYSIVTDSNEVTTQEGNEHLISRLSHFDFSIIGANGTEIYHFDGGGLAAIYTFIFGPGAYLRQTHTWNYIGIQPLPRGTYQIRGILHAAGISGLGIATLETPTITFMIN